ncbi:hypothetical protein [Stenotrophomonas sp. P5_B8]
MTRSVRLLPGQALKLFSHPPALFGWELHEGQDRGSQVIVLSEEVCDRYIKHAGKFCGLGDIRLVSLALVPVDQHGTSVLVLSAMTRTNTSHLHAVLVEIASRNHRCLPLRGLGYLIVCDRDRDRELLANALVKELS